MDCGTHLGFDAYKIETASVLHCPPSLSSVTKFLVLKEPDESHTGLTGLCTWSRMSDTVLRLLAFDTWLWWWRVHAAPGPWLNLSSTSLFIFYTPAEIHLPQRPLLIPTTCPASPGVTIKTLQNLILALSPSIINVHRLNLIILSIIPFSEDALFVLVPFCGIKDQYYGFSRRAQQVFFFF